MSGPESRPRGRLRRSDCSGPGISRRRRGRGFSYLDPEGGTVTDEDALERIRALAIPPAWRDVWICGDPYGHIQATGLDEAGRKQYLYHERWQLRRAQRKFESMRKFAAVLPKLRRAVKKDLTREGMPRERAAVELAREGAPSSKGGAERAIRDAIERVAERLGNTPAVCRSSYIDPRILDRFRDGKTIELSNLTPEGTVTPRRQAHVERRVLELIE